MERFLIIKLSSLGDIIQSFLVLSYLKKIKPRCRVDWVVEEKNASLVRAHPLVDEVYAFSLKGGESFFKKIVHVYKGIKRIRKNSYTAVFDLQKNTKSGFFTLLSRGNDKVGADAKSVSEWPNLLCTNKKVSIDKAKNIRLQYLKIVEQYFEKDGIKADFSVSLRLTPKEEEELGKMRMEYKGKKKAAASFFSKWQSKGLSLEKGRSLICDILQKFDVLMFIPVETKDQYELIQAWVRGREDRVIILYRKSLALIQRWLSELDLYVGVDSAILHLCQLSGIPSIGLFGPTWGKIYNPLGDRHLYIQSVGCKRELSGGMNCAELRGCSLGCLNAIDNNQVIDSIKLITNI